MAKRRCKGTILYRRISGVYTAVAQVIEMSLSGIKTHTYNATTLDTVGPEEDFEPTGYVAPGGGDFSLFLDPSLAGHQGIMALKDSPTTTQWRITTIDTKNIDFTSAGIEYGLKVAMGDGLKMDIKLENTGAVALPTS
ncbi:MAG: hypothetical protein AB7G12_12780 [Thermoanaerobaculia bacterium]